MAENLSTFDHAARIVRSYVNGQHVQSVKYFKIALREHCNPQSLLEDIYEELYDDGKDLIKLLSNVFSNIDKK